MFEQHKTAFFFFLVCTCEHIAPLNTELCYCPLGRGAGHWRVCFVVFKSVCVCVCAKEEKTRHTQALFIPLMSIGVSLNHRNPESYESNQRVFFFCAVWVKSVRVCIREWVRMGAGEGAGRE